MPGNNKIQALIDRPLPGNKLEAQVVLGMVHQLKSWYPMLLFNTKVMQELTWKNTRFVDSQDLQEGFNGQKEYLTHGLPLWTLSNQWNSALMDQGYGALGSC